MREYFWIIKKSMRYILFSIIPVLLFSICISLLQPLELLLIQKITQLVSDRELFSWEILFILIICYVVIHLLKSINPIYDRIQNETIQNKINSHFYEELIKKISKSDLINFYKEEYNTRIVRSYNVINRTIYECWRNIVGIFSGFIGLLSISVLISKNTSLKYLCLFFIISCIQNVYVYKTTKENINMMSFIDRENRKHTYLFGLFFTKENAKEIRSYKIGDWIEKKRFLKYKEIENEVMSFNKKWLKINLSWSTMMLWIEASIVLSLIIQVRNLELRIDQLILIISSYEMFVSEFTNLIDIFSSIFEDAAYIRDFQHITQEETRTITFPKPENDSLAISLKDISFSYIDDKKAIDNINLEIKKGEKISIVGYNGSGKTTLSQIMSQLLNVKNGEVFIGYDKLSAVFQDFAKFSFSLKDNIIVGDFFGEKVNDNKYIYNIMKKSQCDNLIEKLPFGIDTLIGKEFETEGYELSTGEWQKIAFSRSIFGDSDFIIFDEPTSSLDPISEVKQFNYIKNFLERKTVVFVSHRVGLSKLADKIIFMREGKIIETGTHYDLIKLKGEYYTFYNSQAKWYIDEEVE